MFWFEDYHCLFGVVRRSNG